MTQSYTTGRSVSDVGFRRIPQSRYLAFEPEGKGDCFANMQLVLPTRTLLEALKGAIKVKVPGAWNL